MGSGCLSDGKGGLDKRLQDRSYWGILRLSAHIDNKGIYLLDNTTT